MSQLTVNIFFVMKKYRERTFGCDLGEHLQRSGRDGEILSLSQHDFVSKLNHLGFRETFTIYWCNMFKLILKHVSDRACRQNDLQKQ